MPFIDPPQDKPKTPQRKTPVRPSATLPVTAADIRAKALTGYVQIAQVGVLFKGWHADAETLGTYGPPLCREVANLADSDERLAKYVDLICAGGPYTALIGAVVPLLLQLMANHNRIPADLVPGLEDPSVLALRYQTKLAKARRELQAELEDLERYAKEAERLDRLEREEAARV